MTDYSLWEVILNGDSPTPTRVIDGVLQSVSPTNAEQRLARKNELKAHGTLLMALPDKHLMKFNTHKDATTLIKAIDKSLKIYEAEVKSSSFASTSTQNIAFVSSSNTDNTNEPVSAATSVSVVSTKIPVSALLNVDSLSNAVIYSFFASQYNSLQLDNDDLKQIDADNLKEMDLKWQMAMLTVECYNCHRKGHFVRKCRSPKETRRNAITGVFKQKMSLPTMLSWASLLRVLLLTLRLEFIEARFLVYPQNDSVFEEDIKLLKLEVQLRDNALVVLRQNLEKAEQEREDLKLKLEKFQTSSKILSELLASQTNDKTGLGYNSQVFTRAMFDYDDDLSSGSDESLPPSPIYDRPVTTDVPKPSVTRPRQAKTVVTKPNSPPKRHINHSPSPKASTFPPKVTTVKAPMVNVATGVQGKLEWKPKCPVLDHVSRNTSASMTLKRFDYNDALGRSKKMSYLSDFEELNGGYVAFSGNPKGGKISGK
nr:hypothetical protein [Tanacetum cinerariifolium]